MMNLDRVMKFAELVPLSIMRILAILTVELYKLIQLQIEYKEVEYCTYLMIIILESVEHI